MAFDKITNADRAGKGNVGQPDTPALTTTEMQEQMDSLPNLVIEKFNALVDALNDTTAATNVGARVPTGLSVQANVQAIIDGMYTNLKLNTEARHTHANKSTLDGITSEMLESYNRLVGLLDGITAVTSLISATNSAVPTAGAVKEFVDTYDMRSKVLTYAWPVGSVYSGRGVNPSTAFGGSWNVIDNDPATNITRYIRVS